MFHAPHIPRFVGARHAALALAALLVLACGFPPQAAAQIRRPAKKSVAGPNARRPATAEDFLMRLVEMPPERRRAVLDNSPRFQRLPQNQRRRILARLEQIDRMPPAQREQLLERYHLFSRLPPEKRQRARELYGEWVKLDPPRRRMMTRAVERLRGMAPEERTKALESQAFADRFNESERRLIGEIAGLAQRPPADSPD